MTAIGWGAVVVMQDMVCSVRGSEDPKQQQPTAGDVRESARSRGQQTVWRQPVHQPRESTREEEYHHG